MKKGLLALLAATALAVPAMAASRHAGERTGPETLGGFLVKLAASLKAPASDERAAAAALLPESAVPGADLGARLTRLDAARILSDLGVKVAGPVDPGREVSIAEAAQMATAAGLTLSAAPPRLTGDDLPMQCLDEKNPGLCMGCCKPALGFDPGSPGAGQVSGFCAQFCRRTRPPGPSPYEPDQAP